MIDFSTSKFSEKALDFLRTARARLCILHGSVRSSKTVNCDIKWMEYCLTGPQGDLLMVGKTVATLQRNVLNEIRDIVGDKNCRWTNKQQGELFLLGRRVHCVGANSEDAESKIRGATLAGAYCDEANLYPESFFNQLMARLSVTGAQCFCNCNPDSPSHWFYKNFITNDTIKNKQIWHFTLDDNPNLSSEYIESLKQMYTGVFYRRFILGEWCIAEGAIYDMFSEEKNVADLSKLDLPKYPNLIVGCDYGTSTVMSWSLIYYNSDTDTYYKLREYYYDARVAKVQKTDGEFYEEFLHWLGKDIDNVSAVYCDPSAASWKAQLRQSGFLNIQDADNNVINGIRTVATALDHGRYIIDKNCVHTLEEYPNYTWDSDAQSKGIDKPIKINDHACDSDRYVLYTHHIRGVGGVFDAI